MGVGLIIASLLCEDFWSVPSWCRNKWRRIGQCGWGKVQGWCVAGEWLDWLLCLPPHCQVCRNDREPTWKWLWMKWCLERWVECVCGWPRGAESVVLRWPRWRIDSLKLWEKDWGADEEFWGMMFSRRRRMAWSSTVNTDTVFRCLDGDLCIESRLTSHFRTFSFAFFYSLQILVDSIFSIKQKIFCILFLFYIFICIHCSNTSYVFRFRVYEFF